MHGAALLSCPLKLLGGRFIKRSCQGQSFILCFQIFDIGNVREKIINKLKIFFFFLKIRKYILYFLYWPFAGFATDFTLEPLDGGSVDDRTDKSSENFKEKTQYLMNSMCS